MSKYILFAFDRFYPSGGMNDSQLIFDNIKELKDWTITKELLYGYQYYQILCLKDFTIAQHFCDHDEDEMTEGDAKNEIVNWFEINFT